MMHLLKSSYRNRLFAVMLLGSLIPLLICTILMVHITRLQMDNASQADADTQSRIILKEMNTVSEGLRSAADALQGNPAVYQGLIGTRSDRLAINSALFDATENARSFASFDLCDTLGRCLYSTQSHPFPDDLPTDWGVLYNAAMHAGECVFSPAEVSTDASAPLLTGAVQIADARGTPCGYLVMRIAQDGIRSLLDGKYPQSELLILSRFFHPVYASQPYLMTELAPTLRAQQLSGKLMEEDGFVYALFQHPSTGLFLMLRQPRIFTSGTLRLLYTTGLVCALLCVVVSVLVTLPLSRQISLPLLRMQQAFNKLQRGDLDAQLKVYEQDELGSLAMQFNDTVNALKANRAELLRSQRELNEARLRMLQAQLNPHFLCNTLDTMKWISKINKVPQVALMSTNLADILRFCISSEESVPLYREIDILERYIEIQRIRLSDDFTFTLQVNEELYDCMVPKMILQPIVENAVVHGLRGMTGGCITVSADFEGENHFRIVVSDNGTGFPVQMHGRPYARDKKLAKGHLGLYNVDTILRDIYGEEYGLQLGSGENGIGASVTVLLPVRYEEETEC